MTDRTCHTADPTGLDRALAAMAVGRIAWGLAALAAPRLNTRLAGMSHTDGPEMDYMIRVFGARALALGLGHALATPTSRPLWQRLSLVVDTSDTSFGLGHVVRGDLPRRTSAGLTAATGTYAVLGALKAVRDLRAAA